MKPDRKLKVVIDRNIPFISGVLEPWADVLYLPGKEIDKNVCADADALIVRTRTRCDAALLEGTSVSFIASATIGTDHVDLDYLSRRGIAFANAPGCNACGVMQYVHTALMLTARRKGLDLRGRTLGVIGDGNTGERVARLGEFLGYRVLRNDIDFSKGRPLLPKEELTAQSDIISLHLPLDASTRGLVGEDFMQRMKPGSVLVNACRGEVLENAAVLEYRDRLSALILDVWSGEPSGISEELAAVADIATPHIAGYSLEGKINGTSMVVQAFAAHFGIPELRDFVPEHEPTPEIALPEGFLRPGASSDGEYRRTLCRFTEDLLSLFPLEKTDRAFRNSLSSFERMRNEYDYRREFAVPLSIGKLA